MKNGIKIGLITCLLALLACKDTTKSEDPKLYEGTYTLKSLTILCSESSLLPQITKEPPQATGSLTIKNDNAFNWTVRMIDDNFGTLAECFDVVGPVEVSSTAKGTISEASGILDFGTEVGTYRWKKSGKTLTLTDVKGEGIYEFTEN